MNKDLSNLLITNVYILLWRLPCLLLAGMRDTGLGFGMAQSPPHKKTSGVCTPGGLESNLSVCGYSVWYSFK